jgi:hypothetical protein
MGTRKVKSSDAPKKAKSSSGVDLSALVSDLKDNAQKEFGMQGIMTCDEFFNSIDGISIADNFPLQFLVGIDVIPLHRVFHLVGAPASFKSTMAWYFAYKFLEAGGIVVWLDTEHKSNPDMVKAFLKGDSKGYGKQVLVHKLKTLDDTLSAMTKHAKWYDSKIPTKSVPFMLLLDSLGAVTSKEAIERMNKEGKAQDGASFSHAHKAMELTEQFRAYVPTHLDDKPMFMLCTNHLKKEVGGAQMPGMKPKDRTGGGVGKDFASTCTIKMSSSKAASTAEETKRELYMQTTKSSLAPEGRKIKVMMTIKQDPELKDPEGNPIRIAFFDWNTALCELLTDEKQISKTKRNEIIQITRKNAAKYTCTTLGMTDVHPRELGEAIHNNKEIMQGLQEMLGIYRKKVFGES